LRTKRARPSTQFWCRPTMSRSETSAFTNHFYIIIPGACPACS
jgi:hypothetical protein